MRTRTLAGFLAAALLLSVGFITGTCGTALAEPQYFLSCDSCHSMPPADSAGGRIPLTGAVKGNHETHADVARSSCSKCHDNGQNPNAAGYSNSHRNSTIEIKTALGYSRTFVNQTSVPPNPLGRCSTVACHGNGTVFTPSPNWGTTTVNCDTCHSSSPATNSHTMHTVTYSYVCNKCHSNHSAELKPFAHATSAMWNRPIDVHFTVAPNSGGNFASNQCSSIYCHSNGQAVPSYKTVTWGGSVTCASCHGDAAGQASADSLSGRHASHIFNDAVLGSSYGCVVCHSTTVSDNSTIANRANHVNGSRDTAVTCTNCHHNGKGEVRAVVWTGAAFDCAGCHGTSGTFGSPDYISSGAGQPDANSHAKHVTSAASCVNCHSKTTTTGTGIIVGSQHLDGFINVTSGNGKIFGKLPNKTCANISCHSGGGRVMNVPPAQWGNTTLGCQGCHLNSNLSGPHAAHIITRSFGCEQCHTNTASSSTSLKAGTVLHVNYSTNVSADASSPFSYAARTCADISCHSSGILANVPAANWSGTLGCTGCHGDAGTVGGNALSGKHSQHVNNAGFLGTNFGCVECHAKTVSGNAVVSDASKHINAFIDYSGIRAGNSASYSTGTKSCSNIYCHSNGNPGAIVFTAMTGSKVWNGSATLGCNGCHGRSNDLGWPDYNNGGPNTATSNLHGGHLSEAVNTTACANCHQKTVDVLVANKLRNYSTLHLNSSSDLNLNTARTYIGQNATVSRTNFNVTCSSVICHGSGQPVWGQTTGAAHTCQKCHGSKVAAFEHFSSPQVAPGYNGEGTDTSMINSAATSPRVGVHQSHLAAGAISAPVKCGECHVTVTSVSQASHWNYTTATVTFSGRALENGALAAATRSGGLIQCSNTWCHSATYSSGTNSTPVWNMAGVINPAGTKVGDCTPCHSMAPAGYASHPVLDNNTTLSHKLFSVCGGCHTNLNSGVTTVANAFVNKKLHINGLVEAAVGASNCDDCHAYDLTSGGTDWAPPPSGGVGKGAHIKHIIMIKGRLGISALTATGETFGVGEPAAVCGTCHTNTLAHHRNGSRQISFGVGGTTNTMGAGYPGAISLLFGGTGPSFDGTSCANIACHYNSTPSWY